MEREKLCKCMTEAAAQIKAIDDDLAQLAEDYFAGKVFESEVRVREIGLRNKRKTLEDIYNNLHKQRKHF